MPLMLLPAPMNKAADASATKAIRSVYSIRSWPCSSFRNLLIVVMVFVLRFSESPLSSCVPTNAGTTPIEAGVLAGYLQRAFSTLEKLVGNCGKGQQLFVRFGLNSRIYPEYDCDSVIVQHLPVGGTLQCARKRRINCQQYSV